LTALDRPAIASPIAGLAQEYAYRFLGAALAFAAEERSLLRAPDPD
jgi:hypothetical protein